MKGCKALTYSEFNKLLDAMERKYHKPVFIRNKALMVLMVSTGLRIGEAIKLRIQDVAHEGEVGEYITLQRRYTKTKEQGATMPLTPEAREALQEWVTWSGAYKQPEGYWLFPPSVGGSTDQPLFKWGESLDHRSFRKVLDRLKKACFISGKVSTHSMRKTFAKVVHEALENDLMATQRALRHTNIGSTICYLQTNEVAVSKAISKSFASFKKKK